MKASLGFFKSALIKTKRNINFKDSKISKFKIISIQDKIIYNLLIYSERRPDKQNL